MSTLCVVTVGQLDADLSAVVQRGRAHARELGELTPPRIGSIDSALTVEARQIVADWQRDGGYDRALAAISESAPELAVQ